VQRQLRSLEIPEFVSDPAEHPRVPAPIRMLGPVQRALFTHDEGTSAGWLKNSGILSAGTVGQGAETMGSYRGASGRGRPVSDVGRVSGHIIIMASDTPG